MTATLDRRPETRRQGEGDTGAREAQAARPIFTGARRLELLAVAGVMAVSAGLNIYDLNTEGYGNTYYAAAVRSMLTSRHNFFFASFDAGGFVSVDKPPVGLWVQTASARLFGFHGLSLLLPQALAGVLSVLLLYLLVRRTFGVPAGLAAALVLAVTPISVVTDRNNTMDALLVLVLLLAAWSATRAAEAGSLRWLLLSAALVGIGFNIKMLQAYLVVPALALMYGLGAPRDLRARLAHLGAALAVLLVTSLSWALAVDLTPAAQRPYVSDSGANSELSLILGYNGLGRVGQHLSQGLRAVPFLHIPLDLNVAPAIAPGIGAPGPLRLLSGSLAGQASWLLVPAALGLAIGAASIQRRLPLDRQARSLLLWGGWLLAAAGYFSFARFFHPYYLVMQAPPVAALSGIGLAQAWRAYRQSSHWWWLLPALLLVAGLVEASIVAGYPGWSDRLAPVFPGVCLAAAALTALRLLRRSNARLCAAATLLAGLTLLVPPFVWCAVSVANGAGGAWIPSAGPVAAFGFSPGPARGGPPSGTSVSRFPTGGRSFSPGTAGTLPPPPAAGFPGRPPAFGPAGGGFAGGQFAMTFAGPNWDALDPALVHYLKANQGTDRYIVATPTSSYASVFILATGEPALALGGYQGWDRIVTPEGLAQMVKSGDVRFFLLPAAAGSAPRPLAGQPTPADANADLEQWVQNNCAAVAPQAWNSATNPSRPAGFGAGGSAGQQLYDCGDVAAAA